MPSPHVAEHVPGAAGIFGRKKVYGPEVDTSPTRHHKARSIGAR